MVRKFLLIYSLLISWQSACLSMAARIPSKTDLHFPYDNFFYDLIQKILTIYRILNPDPTSKTDELQLPDDYVDQPFDEICGISDTENTPLMSYGMETRRGDFPWHVGLYVENLWDSTYFCGGTLVTSNKVITAAHCVNFDDDFGYDFNALMAYLGKYHIDCDYDDENVQERQVININIHPEYDSEFYINDISILTLDYDVEFTPYVRPACLWYKQYTYGHMDIVNKTGTVVGWGMDENTDLPNTLQMIHMPVVSNYDCLKSLPAFVNSISDGNAFCAGYRNGTSPRNGDSGGGLVFLERNRWYLRGVVSTGEENENDENNNITQYVIFTDVAMYQDFVYKDVMPPNIPNK